MGIDGVFWSNLFINLVKGRGEHISKKDVKMLKKMSESLIEKNYPDLVTYRFWRCEFDDEDEQFGIKLIDSKYGGFATVVVAELLIMLRAAYDMGFRVVDWGARVAYVDDYSIGAMKVGGCG